MKWDEELNSIFKGKQMRNPKQYKKLVHSLIVDDIFAINMYSKRKTENPIHLQRLIQVHARHLKDGKALFITQYYFSMCYLCRVIFPHPMGLITHLSSVHPGEPNKRGKKPYIFRLISNLKKHKVLNDTPLAENTGKEERAKLPIIYGNEKEEMSLYFLFHPFSD